MDGITAMEGNGPRNGKPRKMNVLLFSTDPVALDSAACRMIDLNPEFVPTARAGEKAGLGTYHSENIELAGDGLEQFIARDFKVVRRPPPAASSGRIRSFIKNQLTPRPVVDKSKCNACGTCIKMCPVGSEALKWKEEPAQKSPKHNYNRCIRCYCCQEVCPEGAISIKSPFLGKIVFRGA
jgi:ferredoxin